MIIDLSNLSNLSNSKLRKYYCNALTTACRSPVLKKQRANFNACDAYLKEIKKRKTGMPAKSGDYDGPGSL